jgi:hypothetical protein
MTSQTTKLVVDAGHPAIHIEVMDARYRVRMQGYGRIEDDLPTGFYTVRYATAEALAERDITLYPGRPLVLDDLIDLPFASAAPFALTSTSHEYHQHHAQRLSKLPPLDYGEGAQLFVFLRDLDVGIQGILAAGLSLHRIDGRLVLQFADIVETSTARGEAKWAGRTIALDPGTYRLRLRFGEQSIEMMIVLCRDWQSQVFLLRQDDESAGTDQPILDLLGATQLMSDPAQGFAPQSHGHQGRVTAEMVGGDLRLAELARQALAHGRHGIDIRDLKKMLEGEWQDPLLGIFGLHLLLLYAEANPKDLVSLIPQHESELGIGERVLSLAERVIERLRTTIAPDTLHPDIEILAMEIARRQGKPINMPTLDAPPMLRRSWQMLVQATVEYPALIMPGTLNAQIANRLWGSGAWLVWEPLLSPIQMQSIEDIALRSAGLSNIQVNAEVIALIQNVSMGLLVSPNTQETMDYLIAHSEAAIEQLATQEFSVLQMAVESLLPQLRAVIDQRDLVRVAQEAKLDTTECAIFAQIETLLWPQQRSSAIVSDLLLPSILVPALGVPSSQIQRGMAGMFFKLLALILDISMAKVPQRKSEFAHGYALAMDVWATSTFAFLSLTPELLGSAPRRAAAQLRQGSNKIRQDFAAPIHIAVVPDLPDGPLTSMYVEIHWQEASPEFYDVEVGIKLYDRSWPNLAGISVLLSVGNEQHQRSTDAWGIVRFYRVSRTALLGLQIEVIVDPADSTT